MALLEKRQKLLKEVLLFVFIGIKSEKIQIQSKNKRASRCPLLQKRPISLFHLLTIPALSSDEFSRFLLLH